MKMWKVVGEIERETFWFSRINLFGFSFSGKGVVSCYVYLFVFRII